MATLQGKAVKNTYRQVLQIGANNVGVSGTLQPVQDGAGINTALSLSTTAATINGTLTITGDLIITGGGIQIQDLIDDTVASLIQNGTGITWAYNDTLRTLTPTITIATADGGVQGDFMQLNTGAGEANAVAKIYWNSTDGTAELGLMGAQANNDANSTDTLGLVAENIANNQEGFITTSGLITNVDTTGDLQLEDWNDGDILYLSPTTPGAITKVKPVAPQHTIIVGFVVYSHQNNGKIYVKVDNGYELDELHNVRITAVADNNILQYNSSLAVWENVAGTTTNVAEGTNLYYTQARFDSAFAAKTTTNLAEGTNLYFTTARGDANFATNFATKTTTNLPEGTNLYYTDTRARLALSVTAGTGISYNNGTGVFSLASIPNASLTNSSVTVNSLALPLGGSITLTTTNIAEGTNLYWTDARFDSRFSTKTTTDLAEGTNLYYTQARFNTAFDAKTTTDLDEGTNLYYTDARSRAAISENAVGLDYSSGSGVLSLTAGYAIPTTVKLGEYDIAYNRSIVSAAVSGTSTKTLSLTQQDANVVTATWTDQGITTINGTANQIAATTVGNTTTLAFTNDVTMPNNLVVSGNLTINGTATYVNTQSISAKDPLFEVANDNTTTDAVDIGYYGRYYDTPQTRVEFTGLFRDASDAGKFKFFTGLVDEPTNVVNTTGTGYTVGTLVANFEGNLAGTANAANVLSTARSISATGDAAWTVNFDGSANATAALTLANTGVTATTYGTSTSVPTIAVDGKGRITSASNTNIAFPVTTVNGASGTVVLTTSNVAEGTNQYFTTGRAQSAISLTTSGTSGAATYSGGVFNIPTYIGGSGTANEIAFFSTTGVISSLTTATYPSLTELSYVKGVTSAIQTQLNAKAADNAVVHLAGTETITGAKTFSSALSGTSATFSGNVGVGTVSPYNKLTIEGSSARMDLNDGGGASRKALIIEPLGYNSNAYARIESYNYATATGGNLVLNSTGGRVGIGIDNPSCKLDILGNNTNTDVTILRLKGSAENVGHIDFDNAFGSVARITGTKEGGGAAADDGIIAFSTAVNSVLSERMRITSGGNVGINTDSPDMLLTVDGKTGGASTINLARFYTSKGQSDAAYLQIQGVRHPTSTVQRIVLDAFNGAGSNVSLIFQQGGGNVLIGTTSSDPIGARSSGFAYDNSFGIRLRSTATQMNLQLASSSGTNIQFWTDNGANVAAGSISSTGAVTSYNVTSDYRLKEDFKDLKGLDKVLSIKIYDYKWKNSENRMDGVIAHELQEILPYAVYGEKDAEDMQGVDYSKLVPIMLKAIQEQQAQIEELKALIAAK